MRRTDEGRPQADPRSRGRSSPRALNAALTQPKDALPTAGTPCHLPPATKAKLGLKCGGAEGAHVLASTPGRILHPVLACGDHEAQAGVCSPGSEQGQKANPAPPGLTSIFTLPKAKLAIFLGIEKWKIQPKIPVTQQPPSTTPSPCVIPVRIHNP